MEESLKEHEKAAERLRQRLIRLKIGKAKSENQHAQTVHDDVKHEKEFAREVY